MITWTKSTRLKQGCTRTHLHTHAHKYAKKRKGCIDLTNFNVLSRYETPAPDTSAAVCLGNNIATLQPPMTPIHHPHTHTHTYKHMLPANTFFPPRRPLVMCQMRGREGQCEHESPEGRVFTFIAHTHIQRWSNREYICIHTHALYVMKHKADTYMNIKTKKHTVDPHAGTSHGQNIHLQSCCSEMTCWP